MTGRKALSIFITRNPSSVVTAFALCAATWSFTVAAANDRNVAAKVDGVAITESNIIDALPERASKTQDNKQAALESLISRQLIIRQAKLDKLDQDPKVLAAMQTAYAQILVNAYVQNLAKTIPKPSSREIKTYYDSHPELFSQHAEYKLQEIAITAGRDQLDAVTAQYSKIKTLNEMVEWLKLNKIAYTPTAALKGAEEIPADLLKVLPPLEPNQVIKVERDGGISIIQLLEKKLTPRSLAEATPDIERFLMNQALGNQLKLASDQLRSKVRIEYFSPYKKPVGGVRE